MKIAFCLFNYFPYGGLQRDFLRIAKLAHARGHEVHVYTMRWEGEKEAGLHIHLLPVSGWQNHTRIRSFVKQLPAVFKADGIELVVGFNKMPHLDVYYAADVCYQQRVREQRSVWHRLLPRYRQHLAYEKAVFARGAATQILLISPLQQTAFMQCYQTEAERFHLLPPGIDRSRAAPENAAQIRAQLRSELQLTANDILLLMVGSGFKTKGVDRALHALASLPDELKTRCHLKIIGQDNPASFISLAKELQIASQVEFMGGRSDVPHFLLAADLLLHPSYHENTGTVLLEAVIAGLPVLTLDHCGYAHYILAANCGRVLASPYEQNTFNQTLAEMIVSAERIQWQQNGLAFAKEADIYSMPERAMMCIEVATRTSFDYFMSLKGESYRKLEGRHTQCVRVKDKTYFIKQHRGIGWQEVLKNLLQLRLPVISAKNEWRALEKLRAHGIDAPAVKAYGVKGLSPAHKQSYVLMEALTETISLETLCASWASAPPSYSFKQQLLQEVARIAQVMHAQGINHRDFYLCHFLLDTLASNSGKLYLIDLHRAQIRKQTPERWIIKDLAGLYFSSIHIGLTQRDYLRFIKRYSQKPLRDCLNQGNFWQKVKQRGERLHREHGN